MNQPLGLDFKLLVGYYYEGKYVRDISLLRSNGSAEKVFVQKIPNKPYTWMAQVLSIACGTIGGHEVAPRVRERFAKSQFVETPAIVMQMPIADVNTCMLEIHRRAWRHLLRNQTNVCKWCAKELRQDIELNDIDLSPEDKEKFDPNHEWKQIVCDLPYGYTYRAKGSDGRKLFPDLDGVTFNRFVFRIPTLMDGIRHEQLSDDSIVFWRKVAYDCLVEMQAVSPQPTGEVSVVASFGSEQKPAFGPRLFDEELDAEDLGAIREAIRETLPTMPFFYETVCPCPSQKMIPVSFSAGSFFSE